MVILQEIKMVEDTPDDYIHDLFNRVCWGDHPLGFPICGTTENRPILYPGTDLPVSSRRATRLIASSFVRQEIFDHQEVVDQIEKTFGQIPRSNQLIGDGQGRIRSRRPISGNGISNRFISALGRKGLQYNHSLRFASYVLNTILGGGMSSRLFQEIRENRGLAYSVYSYLPAYIDTGLFVVYAGTSEDSYQEVIDLILKEFKRLTNETFKNGELETAKEHLKGNLLLSLESSDSLMTRLAKNEIYFDSYLPVEQILSGIEAVKEEEVHQLAHELFDERYFCLTMLGPMDGNGTERNLLDSWKR